ncbi:MAG: hypothetical protein K0S04_3967 [Herbinix sp.]|nr:hypothetical protein [Herbinix sp.]
MNNEFDNQPDGYKDGTTDSRNVNEDNATNFSSAGGNAENRNSENRILDNSNTQNSYILSDYPQNSSAESSSTQYSNTESNNSYQGYSSLDNLYSANHNSASSETKVKKKRHVPGFVKLVAAAMAFGLIAGGTFQGYYAITNLGNDKNGNTSNANLTATVTEATDNTDAVAETTSVEGVVADVSDVVANVMPSIVAINSTVTTTSYDFFGRGYSQESQGSGSGIIIGQDDSTLYIATNNHVIEGAADVQIVFADEKTATGTIKGADANSDLAVVTVNMNDLSQDTAAAIKIATLGSSENVKAGEMAIAIGNALGYGQSVTVGYISAVDREVTIDAQTMTLLQTDAAINPGNSGGALINAAGQVIGINSVKYASEEVEGMGYAIPISKAVPIINELMNREVVATGDQGFLGLDASTAQEVTEAYAERFNMPIGVYVNDIIDNSPAADAGLKQGDIITGLDSSKIESLDDLVSALSYKKAGQEVSLIIQVKENGQYVDVSSVSSSSS